MNIHIETDRWLIREIEPTDLEGLFELDSDPAVHRYLGNRPVQNREETRRIIASVRKQYETHGIGRWAIIEKSTGNFIGWTGLKYETVVRKGFPYYDLGYRLKSAYWGKGIATETALESLKYGFETLKLEEICAAANIENVASNKVLNKVGFKFIETFEFDEALCNWYKMEKKDGSDRK